jgi:broad specificity phosphatase PhoE
MWGSAGEPVTVAREVFFVTHPNVVISSDAPVPQWPLSDLGRVRMQAALAQPWVRTLSAVYCSTEQKAIDGADILARHCGLDFQLLHALGENDRSSTGFLPPDEFERVADQFFARPDESVRGWETAAQAQHRIVTAVRALIAADTSPGAIAIVSHGAVGTLLYCHLAGVPISRQWDQPANGGGNFLSFNTAAADAPTWWQPMDAVAGA